MEAPPGLPGDGVRGSLLNFANARLNMISLESLVRLVVYLIVAGLIFWLSGNVSPGPAVDDAVYLGDADEVLAGQFFLGNSASGVSLTDQEDKAVSKLGGRAILSARYLPLEGGVRHVVSVRANFKVSGVDARRVVAPGAIVKDVQTFRDLAVRHLPREAVGENHLAPGAAVFRPRPVFDRNVNLAIALLCLAALPDPARALRKAELEDFAPESDGKSFFHGLLGEGLE